MAGQIASAGQVYVFTTLINGRVKTMADVLVVVSKVKKMVKEQGLRTSEGFVEALSKKVEEIVKNAVEKVKSEGKKKTLGAEDLM